MNVQTFRLSNKKWPVYRESIADTGGEALPVWIKKITPQHLWPGSSVAGSIERLAETVDQAAAKAYLGDCYDEADWAAVSSNGTVSRDGFAQAVHARNFAPSLATWLDMWRVDSSIVPALDAFGVGSPSDLFCLEQSEIDSLGLKPVKRVGARFALSSPFAMYRF